MNGEAETIADACGLNMPTKRPAAPSSAPTMAADFRMGNSNDRFCLPRQNAESPGADGLSDQWIVPTGFRTDG
jgi:hypothetical protein